MHYYHVDVFASRPLNGNGLTVVFPEQPVATEILQKIAQEFQQFETIFIFPRDSDGTIPVRIFTVQEELAFAGHPLLGAGAVLHHRTNPAATTMQFNLELPEKIVTVTSQVCHSHYEVTMDQSQPQLIQTVATQDYTAIATCLNLRPEQLAPEYPLEVVSTGLPYLLVPVRDGLDQARIRQHHFEQFLHRFGAKFVYVFDVATLECRTWDNSGLSEDVATGSAAGPLCAYLVRNGHAKPDTVITLSQGKYRNRPSLIQGWVAKETGNVLIRGSVAFFGSGEILDCNI